MRPLLTLVLTGVLITAAALHAQPPDGGKRAAAVRQKGDPKATPPAAGPVTPATRAPIADRLATVAARVNGRQFKEYVAEDNALGLDLLRADPDKLLAELNAAVRAAPNDPYLYKTRALCFVGPRTGPRYGADLEQVLALAPRTANDRLLRADALTLLGRNREAVQYLDGLLTADPDNPLLLSFRAVALFQDGRADASGRDLDRAIELLPGCANSHYNRGRLLRSLGRQEEAVAEYTRAIELFALPTEYINRANCYTSLNRADEALADYARAIELAPHHASLALYNRGCLYELLKRPADALADYTAAIRSNPNGRDGYVGRAGLYMDAGRHDLAVADCTAALEIDPSHLTAVFNRGASLLALGRPREALRDLSRAIALSPKLALAYRKRAAAYEALGDTARAEADLRTATSLTAPQH